MRIFLSVGLCLLATRAVQSAEAPTSSVPVTYFDSDPAHLWNRLHTALFTRPDRQGNIVGHDALDLTVFPTTRWLLEGPSHAEAVGLLDEFLADGHRLVRDPIQRAIMQRDLWAVFDWATFPYGNFYSGGTAIRTGPLQQRLARAIRILALSKEEANALPDSYALAVKSQAFAVAFSPAQPNRPFLAPDLFDPAGPWVCVAGPADLKTPMASEHARVFAGRSVFLVFIRLPEGRKATLAYLDKLNAVATPWKVPSSELSAEVPQFPVETQFALVRQMIALTGDGKLVPTSIVESVQFRTYREILPTTMESQRRAENAQGFVELELRRGDLFKKINGGLRANGPEDRVPSALMFFRGWEDDFEAKEPVPHTHYRLEPLFRQCAGCHSGAGIRGVNSYTQTGSSKPRSTLGLFPANIEDMRTRSAQWKTGLTDWSELRKLAGS